MTHLCRSDEIPSPVVRILGKLTEPCCFGSAEYGPTGCTCWEPIYDLTQQDAPLSPDGIPATRKTMCDDCAFRPDSPERQGDERYNHHVGGDDEVFELGHFWCHQGMRKPVGWRHPVGITIDADTDAYDPLLHRHVNADGSPYLVPYKADGTPGDRCAGQAAHAR